MKFGKLLLRAIDIMPEAWRDHFMQYKHLKKLIKAIVEVESFKSVQEESKEEEKTLDEQKVVTTSAEILSQSKEEKEFFTCLTNDLKNVSNFYETLERQFSEYHKRFQLAWQELCQVPNPSPNLAAVMRKHCVDFHRELLMLENYTYLNLLGFQKILKKHDKKTGHITKDKYITKLVNKQSFHRSPTLLGIVNSTEMMFRDINNRCQEVPALRGAKRKRSDSEDEACIRELSKMRQEVEDMEQNNTPKRDISSGLPIFGSPLSIGLPNGRSFTTISTLPIPSAVQAVHPLSTQMPNPILQTSVSLPRTAVACASTIINSTSKPKHRPLITLNTPNTSVALMTTPVSPVPSRILSDTRIENAVEHGVAHSLLELNRAALSSPQ